MEIGESVGVCGSVFRLECWLMSFVRGNFWMEDVEIRDVFFKVTWIRHSLDSE